MVRTIVQLTDIQATRLKRLARERDASVASLVREAVEDLLEREAGPRRAERARELAGAFRSGLGDLAENHDVYLDPTVPGPPR
jgi:predicted transcriptional regulator